MAVSEHVMDLVALLDAEDFSALAGEILAEISLGREEETEEGEISRVLIPAAEQLREAVDLLRLRLTEPARRLAEAEVLAGELNGGDVVPIVFINLDGQPEVKPAPVPEGAQSRSTVAIQELEAGLDRLVAIQSGIV